MSSINKRKDQLSKMMMKIEKFPYIKPIIIVLESLCRTIIEHTLWNGLLVHDKYIFFHLILRETIASIKFRFLEKFYKKRVAGA